MTAFNMTDVDVFLEQLREEIDAPYVSCYKSTLGGEHRVSILLAVSLDPKASWTYDIFENSRHFKLHIGNDGVIETITGPGKPRFRKTRFKSFEDAIARINKFVREYDAASKGAR